MSNSWVRVVFADDCDEEGNCPNCDIDYAECGCPGPTMDEYYEYHFDEQGVMWAKKLDDVENPDHEDYRGRDASDS